MRRCCVCGGKAEIIPSMDAIINSCSSGYKVICSNIGCTNATDWYSSEYQAISAWQDSNIKTMK
jgi:hypothetical protein